MPTGAPTMQIMSEPVWIAVFGDVHGTWDAMFTYCEYCAPKTEPSAAARISLVLQCGDIGLFSASPGLDKATRRYAEQDVSELGADEFLSGARRISIPTYFVRGNHEDFGLLPEDGDGQIGSAQGLHHIYKRPVALEIQDRTITVAGLGGIAARGTHAAAEWVEEDFPDRYFTRREVEALMGLAPCSVDILICHDGPAGASLRITQDAGSETITRLIRRLQPRLMMHGHYHDPPEPYRIGETLCVCLNHPRSWRFPNRDGGMGLVDPASREFVWASPMG